MIRNVNVEQLKPGDIVEHMCSGLSYCLCDGKLGLVITVRNVNATEYEAAHQDIRVLFNGKILDGENAWCNRHDFFKIM